MVSGGAQVIKIFIVMFHKTTYVYAVTSSNLTCHHCYVVKAVNDLMVYLEANNGGNMTRRLEGG